MPPPQFYHRNPNPTRDLTMQADNWRQMPPGEQGSTTIDGQSYDISQSQSTNAQPRDAVTDFSTSLSTMREGGWRQRTPDQEMAARSYQSQVNVQSNAPQRQPVVLESGGAYWLKRKTENDTYKIYEHRNAVNDTYELSDDGCLRPVVVLRSETDDRGTYYRAAIVTSFQDMSLEEWTAKRVIRTDVRYSVPLMKDAPSFSNALYNPSDTITDPLYLARGQLDKLSYVRIDRTLEVPPEALEELPNSTGTTRLCFLSFQKLMNAFGISKGHDQLFFGRRLVLEGGATCGSQVDTTTPRTPSLDNTTSANPTPQTATQPTPPTLFDLPRERAASDLEWSPGWSPDEPRPGSPSIAPAPTGALDSAKSIIHDQEWIPGWTPDGAAGA
ncbi:uncharacterized protein PAC_08696 [Phialocephala subalpina]|uniref:Uncharacterized protein n=1 Tax=Phialocephala subalpina TaxID=576137 RepID=A0A1L7X1A4_9HELO|nr:uncharacterized protein PAC_08696 [Phialocephala subalpina]